MLIRKTEKKPNHRNTRPANSGWLIFLFIAVSTVGGCVNEAKLTQRDMNPEPTNKAIAAAVALNRTYVAISRGRFKLIAPLEFETRSLGIAQLMKGFISDGSSSLVSDDEGSRLAGFLHDALYRGSPFLKFPQGFPGPWTKSQADQEYCFQLKRLAAGGQRSRINCLGPKLLPTFVSPWDNHRLQREKYWRSQQKLAAQPG